MAMCLAMLSDAQAVVADLSPFRGPHVDGGTAFKIGYAVALGLPVSGFANQLRPLPERIKPRAPGERIDIHGLAIEDTGELCNAMIAGALTRPTIATAKEAITEAARLLANKNRTRGQE